MKLYIENFGPIENFEYDLEKDIIITYGKNNIGKSYAMSVLYLILRTFSTRNLVSNRFRLFINYDEKGSKGFDKIAEKATVDGTLITNQLCELACKKLDQDLADELDNSFRNTFGDIESLTNTIEKTLIKIQIDGFELIITLSNRVKITSLKVEKQYILKKVDKKSTSRNYKNKKYIYIEPERKDYYGIMNETVHDVTLEIYRLLNRKIEDVYYLPASRSGLYTGMGAFTQIIAQLSKNRHSITKKIEIPGLSEPISDYIASLSEINRSRSHRKSESVKALIGNIEEKILNGEVSFDNKSKALKYKSFKSNEVYDLNYTSSMVSEISPIVAFLKFIVDYNSNSIGKTILFIEEPEAHLHPSVQVELIETFVKFTDHNIKLVITSHSNYIFNKLNNMVLGRIVDHKKYSPILLAENENGSLSGYMEIDEYGASDENFLDIAEDLFDERENYIEILNEEHNDEW